MMIGKPDNNLADYGHLLLRRAIDRDDWIADQILDLAAGDQSEWTPQDWFDLLTELETSDMTVDDFLVLYT